MFNKLGYMLLAGILVLGLCGCEKKDTKNKPQEMVTVKTLNADKQEVDINVPLNPQKIVVLDMPTLDILDFIGVGNHIIGTAKEPAITYLNKYFTENTPTVGTIGEANLEKIMEAEPDIIFIGGRLRKSYDKLSKIAPVIYISLDQKETTLNGLQENAENIAKIFAKEEMIAPMIDKFHQRTAKLAKEINGKTAIIGLTTAGTFKVVGDSGRCSILSEEVGFHNIGLNSDKSVATHGNEVSFEYIVEKNPNYLVVLDRDSAIGRTQNKMAKEVIENELIKELPVYKNANIIYLETPAIWYMAEGGIQAMNIMLSGLENQILKEKN